MTLSLGKPRVSMEVGRQETWEARGKELGVADTRVHQKQGIKKAH